MSVHSRSPFRIVLLATGGTIEKSYDAGTGTLTLDMPVIERLLASLDQSLDRLGLDYVDIFYSHWRLIRFSIHLHVISLCLCTDMW